MNDSFYNFITEDLSSGLTCLCYNHTIYFCTLDKQFFNIDIKQPENKKTIFCYDAFNSKIINIVVNDIEYCHIINADDITENNKTILDIIEFCKLAIADLQLTTDKSVDEIYNTILDSTFIDFTSIEYSKIRINFLKAFNLSIPNDNILINEIDKIHTPNIIEAFKRLIQLKIDENNQELDELINECTEDDDIEDINSIKEMFNGVLSEIDEDITINNGEDLINLLHDQWPPLLLPLPDDIRSLETDIQSIFDIDGAEILVQKEIRYIINSITDLKELEIFLNELQSYESIDDNIQYCIGKVVNRIDYLQSVEQ